MSKKFVAGVYAVVGLCLLVSSAFAVNMNNAGWYLHVDVESIKSGAFGDLISEHQDQDNEDVESFLNLALGKELKQQIRQVTLYGDQAGYNDFTIIAQGPFSKSARNTFFDKVKLGADSSTSKFNGATIHQWTFDGYESDEVTKIEKSGDGKEEKTTSNISIHLDGDDDVPMVLFSAQLDSKMIILSRDKEEVKSWLKGSYSKKTLNSDGVFSVVVHLDRAIAHGGLNFGEEVGDIDIGFDSKMMNKLTQFSFSVSEEDANVLLEVGLVAKDEKVAMQLKNIVSGLIALQAMAGDIDEEIQSVVQNLSIDVDGVNLLLKTTVSTKNLQDLVD